MISVHKTVKLSQLSRIPWDWKINYWLDFFRIWSQGVFVAEISAKSDHIICSLISFRKPTPGISLSEGPSTAGMSKVHRLGCNASYSTPAILFPLPEMPYTFDSPYPLGFGEKVHSCREPESVICFRSIYWWACPFSITP